MRLFWTTALSLTLAAATTFAMGVEKPPAPPSGSNPSIPASDTQAQATGARAEAEQSYALAYDEIAKAKKDVEAGKAKNAEKKFKRALERVEKATALAPDYHEAWNLVGYCARKLGDYPKAFAAYDRCLAVKADFAPAREYLGEAYLEQKEPGKAREQLALLERLGAEVETKTLKAAIDAYVAAHPEAQLPAGEPAAPAASDTTSSSGQ